MTIFEKLNAARNAFHSVSLKKSGENKFSGYKYFELGDILPTALKVMSEQGLCAVISFDASIATMTIHDGDHTIVFTSPMGSAALKGCHEVQNIGAVETYQRRYLWVSALEIIEQDGIEAVTGKPDQPTKPDQAQQKAAPAVKVNPVSEDQIIALQDAMVEKGMTNADFFKMAKVNSFADLDAARFDGALAAINKKVKS